MGELRHHGVDHIPFVWKYCCQNCCGKKKINTQITPAVRPMLTTTPKAGWVKSFQIIYSGERPRLPKLTRAIAISW